MQRNQQFALVREAINMLSFSTNPLTVAVNVEAPGNDFVQYQIERIHGQSTFKLEDEFENRLAEGASELLLGHLRQLAPRGVRILSIFVMGPPAIFGNDWGSILLYDSAGRVEVPFPRRRNVIIDPSGQFELLPIRQ